MSHSADIHTSVYCGVKTVATAVDNAEEMLGRALQELADT